MSGKRILLFAPVFYSYYLAIADALRKNGAYVDLYTIKYGDIGIVRKKVRVVKKVLLRGRVRYIKGRLDYLKKIEESVFSKFYDIFFVVQLYPYDISFISRLKSLNPSLQTYIFFWDPIVGHSLTHTVSCFDNIFCFSRKDVEILKMYLEFKDKHICYLPNFYLLDDSFTSQQTTYDIAFIGTVNADTLDRYAFLQKINEWCRASHLNACLYLRRDSTPFSIFHKLILLRSKETREQLRLYLRYKNAPWVHTDKLSIDEVKQIECSSKCLLDITHLNHQGYTLNVLSAIGKGKKLITTNHRISQEPFYHPNNISIVDACNPVFDRDFFDRPIVPIDISCLEIHNWLSMIFDPNYYADNIDKVS